jgi:hypothetical protein
LVHRFYLILIVSSSIRIVPSATAQELKQNESDQKFPTYSAIDPKRNLYEIDDHSALQTIYVNHKLSEIRVLPKYKLEKSSLLTSPDIKWLSEEKYSELLKQIEDVKPLGKLAKPLSAGASSNNISSFEEQYEYGVLYYDEKNLPSNDPNKLGKRVYCGFHITFYREVMGKLIEKEMFYGLYMLKIDNDWYRTTKEEYQNHKVGQKVTVKSAAPLVVSL